MDAKERKKLIERTSALGIVVNLLVAAMKIIIGAMASSLAVISEGINNASDAVSAALTLIGTRLSSKLPDEKHPFGYGRIEYLTGLVVSVIILYAGIELLKESILGIIHPKALEVNWLTIVLVAISAVVKLLLGSYTIRAGKKAESAVLVAVGKDSRNDSLISAVTIAVSIFFLFTKVSLDAYAGVLISIVVLKAGLETMTETVGDLLGKPGKPDLAEQLYREIRATPGIINAADMMLHDYGPDNWSGSVNVELDHECTVGEVYAILHALQLRIMHEYHVTMVFGVYAVDNDHEDVRAIRKNIVDFIRSREHVKSLHALYLEPQTDKIYVDFVVDYQLRDYDSLKASFAAYMEEHYPGREIVLTIETEYV